MKFGTIEITNTIDSNSSITDIEQYNDGQIVKNLVKHKMRVKVADVKQEMIEFMKFSDDMHKKRKSNKLAVLKDDVSTLPSITLQFPRFNEDGSYFVVKTWTEVA